MLWLWYLRKIDLFEAEKLSYLLLTLGLGMVFCILVFPVSDWLFSVRYPWHETGSLPHDVLFYTVAVGLVEEAVKFVPFLLVLAMTKEIDEPIDYLIYASNAALGFAFMENLEYFHRGSLDIMTMRMLLSVFGHMFFTSTAAYGVVLGMRSGSTVKRYLYPLVGYLLAAIVHGLYDALLLNGHVITAYLLQALVIFQFGIYLTNLLNASPHFSESHADDAHALKTQIFYGFVAVLILQYFAVVMESGPGVADATLAVSAVLGIGFLVLLASRLVPHGLHHGEWMVGLEGVVRGTISAPIKEDFRTYARTIGAIALGLYVIAEHPDLLLQYGVIIALRLLVAIIQRWRAVRKAARTAAVATPA